MFVDLKQSPAPDQSGAIPIEISQVAYRNSFVLRAAVPYATLESVFGGKVPDNARVNVQFGFGVNHGRLRITKAEGDEGYSLVSGSRRVPLVQIARRPGYVVNAAFSPVPATDVIVNAGCVILTLPKEAFATEAAFDEASNEA